MMFYNLNHYINEFTKDLYKEFDSKAEKLGLDQK